MARPEAFQRPKQLSIHDTMNIRDRRAPLRLDEAAFPQSARQTTQGIEVCEDDFSGVAL